jgi:hypothetical protein
MCLKIALNEEPDLMLHATTHLCVPLSALFVFAYASVLTARHTDNTVARFKTIDCASILELALRSRSSSTSILGSKAVFFWPGTILRNVFSNALRDKLIPKENNLHASLNNITLVLANPQNGLQPAATTATALATEASTRRNPIILPPITDMSLFTRAPLPSRGMGLSNSGSISVPITQQYRRSNTPIQSATKGMASLGGTSRS